MNNAKTKVEPRTVALFNFTYVIVAAGIGFAALNQVAGRVDPMFTSIVLICVGVGAPLAAWISTMRLRKAGSLELNPESDSSAPGNLAELLDAFLDSPVLDAEGNVYSFTRGHRFRGIPVSSGLLALLPGLIFVFNPVPGISRDVWIAEIAGAVLLIVGGYFWRFRFVLNLKEKMLTTSLWFRKTDQVAAIGAQAAWILATQGNALVLQEGHALYVFDGKEMIQISNFEKPHRPVFGAGEAMARAAGVPLIRLPVRSEEGSLVNSEAAIHLDWWVISLPVAFILTMVALQILRGSH